MGSTVIGGTLSKRRRTSRLSQSCSLRQQRLLGLMLLLAVAVAATTSWSALSRYSFSKPLKTLSIEFVESKPENETSQDSIQSTVNVAAAQNNLSSATTIKPKAQADADVEALNGDVHVRGGLQKSELQLGPYHNWEMFSADFQEMLNNLKIFVYPDVFINDSSSPFTHIFLPHPNPLQPKLGNYLSEHMFKISLLGSSVVTSHPEEAHFFFMPFSVNILRNDPLVHSEASIADFVSHYTTKISRDFKFWNASKGSDHFFVCCHSVGRDAASKHRDLQNNAIQITCSSSYFQRFYVTHKDVGLPQVWPRPPEKTLTPPDARSRLVFFSGRMQNSRVRQELIATWANDTCMDIFTGSPPFPYEEGFRRSKYCLHMKGYEVNTARISDAMHYGCIPVIISNHYDLPFANVLDWSKFSVIINHGDIGLLKQILLSISRQMYLSMYQNLCQVRRHFQWHTTPRGFDSFYMTAYQLWLKRGIHRLP